MQRPLVLLVPIGRVTTTRARLPDVVATVGDDLGLGQVCGCGDPGAGVGSVLTWTVHRVALLAQRFGPELYDKCLLGATRCSRYSLPSPCTPMMTAGRRATRRRGGSKPSPSSITRIPRCPGRIGDYSTAPPTEPYVKISLIRFLGTARFHTARLPDVADNPRHPSPSALQHV